MEKHIHSKSGRYGVSLVFFFLAAAVAAVLGAVASLRAVNQPSSPEQAAALRKIAPWVTQHTAGGKASRVHGRSGRPGRPESEPRRSATKSEKGRFVRDALWNKSQTTQGPNPAMAA